MKTFLSFFVIGLFAIVSNVSYAADPIYEQVELMNGKEQNRSAFKISERKVLKDLKEQSVSSFSMEELRLGAQRFPEKSEIQYFKSQCRYAFMSEQDIIANRCETKKVSMPK